MVWSNEIHSVGIYSIYTKWIFLHLILYISVHFTKKKYSFLFIGGCEGEELFFECACVALQEVREV